MSAVTAVSAAEVPREYVFASRRHPGDASAPLVYARSLTGPLSFAMIVVMIAATASMLLGVDPLRWVAWAAPAAAAVAAAFAVFTMRRTPAELILLGDRAAVRSVWDVAANRPIIPEELLPPRRVQGGIDVGIGRDVQTLTLEEWPELARIEAALERLVPPARPDTW